MIKKFRSLYTLLLMAVPALLTCSCQKDENGPLPNVLFIAVDDLRPDVLKVWHLGDRFRDLNPGVVPLPLYFEAHGYRTVSMGKIFHNHMPDSVSFMEPDLRPDPCKTAGMIDRDPESFYVDEFLRQELALVRERRLQQNPGAYADSWAYGRSTECREVPDTAFYDGAQTELAIQTMKRLQSLDSPFFLALGYFRPHLPFSVPKKYRDLYDRETLSELSTRMEHEWPTDRKITKVQN